MISACGLICNECPFYNNPCRGCFMVEGKTFWAIDHLPEKICPLFDCSINQRSYSNCGDCSELPCKKFADLKDPSISDDEHKLSIKKRIDILRKGK